MRLWMRNFLDGSHTSILKVFFVTKGNVTNLLNLLLQVLVFSHQEVFETFDSSTRKWIWNKTVLKLIKNIPKLQTFLVTDFKLATRRSWRLVSGTKSTIAHRIINGLIKTIHCSALNCSLRTWCCYYFHIMENSILFRFNPSFVGIFTLRSFNFLWKKIEVYQVFVINLASVLVPNLFAS